MFLKEVAAEIDEGIVAAARRPAEVAEQLVGRGRQLTLLVRRTWSNIHCAQRHKTSQFSLGTVPVLAEFLFFSVQIQRILF
jgi:hypothetical protein